MKWGGGIAMLMDADTGEGGVKNQPKSADVVYGRPLMNLFISSKWWQIQA